MRLTEQDLIRASRDDKFMAARWKQRVAVSQARLDKKLGDPNISREEKERQVRMHKSRIQKMKEYKER